MSGEQLTARRGNALVGAIDIPGDKSISHRALILGGLANGETHISGLLEGDDVLRTANAVRVLGARVERIGKGAWRVVGGNWRSSDRPIDCGNSGTGARLLMGAVAGLPIKVSFVGDASLSRRPMGRVLDPLRVMGARILAADGDRMPVTIQGGGLSGISFVNEKASAQVKSAILFAGLHALGDVEVIEPVPSRDHSENMLRAFGCDLEVTGNAIRLGAKRELRGVNVAVPADPSSAAFALVAALICHGSSITTRGVMLNPHRTGLLTALGEMGAALDYGNRRTVGGEAVADILAQTSVLHGVEVPPERAPSMIDEYPILAVAAAFAQGRSVMHGLAELRVKESDRLAAIVAGLNACGIEASEQGDSLIVEGCGGTVPGGATIDANHDHRLAMAFLVLGLGSDAPVTVTGAETIATSFPDFAAIMTGVGANIA